MTPRKGGERFLALAEGSFGPTTSKTANACIRYTPKRVVAVVDSRHAGEFGGLADGDLALLKQVDRQRRRQAILTEAFTEA